MKRVVLDTNVLVSSALGGALEVILDQWVDEAFQVVITSEILDEYLQVLNRPKFKIKQTTIDKITTYIYLFAEFVIPEESIEAVQDDPSDNKFLEAAIAGSAEYVVSGDKHLLSMKKYRQISIITAREFLTQLDEI